MPGKVFDEQGNEIDPSLENDVQEITDTPDPVLEEETEEIDPDSEVDTETPVVSAKKYRIGDQEFDTQEEALAYATNQVSTLQTEVQVTDAYRRGIQEGSQLNQPPQTVTPPPEEDIEQKFFANPKAFLDEMRTKIKTEVHQEVMTAKQQADLSEKIWGDFARRHPDLADFRNDVEDFAAKNLIVLKAINSAKGIDAGYDFIATKVRSKFEAYMEAKKPRRDLQNGAGKQTPSGKGTSVTPKTPPKKPLSFSQQIKNMKATKQRKV